MTVKQERLSLDPHEITPDVWYYEDPKGIELVHRITVKGIYIRTDSIVIPWRKIEASFKRYDKARRWGVDKGKIGG